MQKEGSVSRIEALMTCLESCARLHYDGHFTVMRFTTNWRVCFGTPIEIHHELAGVLWNPYEPG
jgi:hypothetical protein